MTPKYVVVKPDEDVIEAIIKEGENIKQAWVFISQKCLEQLKEDAFHTIEEVEIYELKDNQDEIIIANKESSFPNVQRLFLNGKLIFEEKLDKPEHQYFFIKKEEL